MELSTNDPYLDDGIVINKGKISGRYHRKNEYHFSLYVLQ